jgi:hypothetical protein
LPPQTTFDPDSPVKWKTVPNGKSFRAGVTNQTQAQSTCRLRLVDGAGTSSGWQTFQDVPGGETQYSDFRFDNADTSTGAIQVEITLENPPGNPPADLSFTIEPLKKVGN